MDLTSPDFWIAVGQIIVIDILLGGDNAVVIALASRRLPAQQRVQAIFWGMFGAVALRVVLIFFALELLRFPYLKIVGGLLLLWIGIKLLLPADEDGGHEIDASMHLMGAIKTIVLADAVMSLDNVIGIAGAAKGHLGLVIFGLVVSVPIIVWGSRFVLTLMDRFPVVILFGAALLGWIAGDMIAHDVVLTGPLAPGSTTSIPAGAAAPYATTIYWRTFATNGTIESPRSAWVAFRTPNAPSGGGGGGGGSGSVGAPRNITLDEALSIIVGYHDGTGANLGSRSSRDSRNAFLASAVASIYYGHVRWNSKGPDNGWCIKDGGSGRPQSDDVIVRCSTRDAWDLIGGAGADGYRFHTDYIGVLPREQNVYPPPRSALPQ